jgi:adenine-specific DNA methylase
MLAWRDLFSHRQLLCHGVSVEVFRELLESERVRGLSKVTEAAFGYLTFSMDKLRDYNSRMARWHVNREVTVNTFDRHDFSFKWSYAEMDPLIDSIGYDWAIEQTGKCIKELVALVQPNPLFKTAKASTAPVTLTCKSGEALDHIADTSVDAIVMDPPYYDNVMYAELSDFFYVWLKRTAGLVYPELFRRKLTDKENEAVANPARFKGQKGAKALAGREYQDRMAAIFTECRRVLKHNGIMTLMFTHKATGAWDALTKGLMKAGFIITASWPINTESEGSLHIKDKAAANSTIFLVCRPRPATVRGADEVYWEDVEPEVAAAVRKRVKEFQNAGIGGVDLYLASFGPALEEFSKHWPLRRGTPRPEPEERKYRVQKLLFEEPFDPYAVTPEDALDAARKEVKRWRLDQLSHQKARAELDPITSFFVLAWDAFKAPAFDYDEALRLARAVGVDLDKDIVGHLAEKKGSDIHLWDSARRAAKGALGPADGSRGMIDAIHHGAHAARTRTLAAARELLERARIDQDARFYTSLQAVLEVLPVSKAFSGIDLAGDVLEQSNDFEVLENLRRLAFAEQVDKPVQLLLFEGAAG